MDIKETRGRPKKENSRGHYVKARLNDDEYDKLHHMAIETGMTNSEILRKALIFYYNFFKKRL